MALDQLVFVLLEDGLELRLLLLAFFDLLVAQQLDPGLAQVLLDPARWGRGGQGCSSRG